MTWFMMRRCQACHLMSGGRQREGLSMHGLLPSRGIESRILTPTPKLRCGLEMEQNPLPLGSRPELFDVALSRRIQFENRKEGKGSVAQAAALADRT